ncbi:AAA family ATPase [Clostridium sp. AF19-22AC]|jgi:transcriptional regulator with PAS, ATPase and Fis domain|uniref:sigma-54-dependent Fis family transcriptional regulator n=1 Tax=Clostridia TaxID=186801 RepID=UPI000E4B77D9|nr:MULTISPECIES: sigma-54-dependent Fis family transcriptional regulator [Clostridia]RHR31491.1 AAA family ATPase [Clostridium sp. AF19-22AC]
MEKTKILAIAPYRGMYELILLLGKRRNTIELTVYEADLNEGVNIVKHLNKENFDVIISRGQTAELLSKNTTIPVIEISFSVYDILRGLKLAEGYGESVAIVGFSGITSCAAILCDLLRYKSEIITVTSKEHALTTLERLQQKKCQIILCDTIVYNLSRSLGLNAILITSGTESIENAFDQALKVSRSYTHIKQQLRIFTQALSSSPESAIILDSNNNTLYNSMDDTDENTAVFKYISRMLTTFWGSATFTAEQSINNKMYLFSSRQETIQNQKYLFIFIASSPMPQYMNSGAIEINEGGAAFPDFYNAYFNSANSLGGLKHTLSQYAQNAPQPILILGEPGTGKSKAASILYQESRFHGFPIYTILCGKVSSQYWKTFTTSPDSPLLKDNCTIFFNNIDALGKPQVESLIEFIEYSNLLKRNYLLFSLNSTNNTETNSFFSYLTSHISCLTLRLPPLRERLADIPSLCSLYINEVNMQTGKQITGFETDAIKILEEYDWPNNLTQFKRIVRELVITCNTPYITADNTENMLSKEPKKHNQSLLTDGLDLSGKLSEITYQIVLRVLTDENNNQTKAAERLGISRSTLWRILKTNL